MYRGDGSDRPVGMKLPPGRMPLVHRGRPLKRWRYAGLFGEAMMLCAGEVRVGGIPQVFWAVWDRQADVLRERTVVLRTGPVHVGPDRVQVRDRDVEIDLRLEQAGKPVEVVSRHGRAHIWTRKWPIVATGHVVVDGAVHPFTAAGIVDESAGYHARHTAWEWAAGVGTATDGRTLAWNLVSGVHDAAMGSERTVWVDGEPSEVGPSEFGTDLEGVTYPEGSIEFTEERSRRRRDRLGVISSDYVQPFGTVRGHPLPGIEISGGYGVMERHRATW